MRTVLIFRFVVDWNIVFMPARLIRLLSSIVAWALCRIRLVGLLGGCRKAVSVFWRNWKLATRPSKVGAVRNMLVDVGMRGLSVGYYPGLTKVSITCRLVVSVCWTIPLFLVRNTLVVGLAITCTRTLARLAKEPRWGLLRVLMLKIGTPIYV